MSVERDILEALQAAAVEAVAASALSTLPIKFLLRTFPIPNDQKYLEIVHLPNNITGQYWGVEKTYRGTFRLLLHWQNNDEGAYSPIDLINKIGSFFAKGKSLPAGPFFVKITDIPDMSSPLEAGNESIFVLSIRYQCFAP